jgi:hypothetical protein
MTLRAKKQMELALRVPLLSKLAPGENLGERPPIISSVGTSPAPTLKVKPFENQMNNEQGTSAIFFSIEFAKVQKSS